MIEFMEELRKIDLSAPNSEKSAKAKITSMTRIRNRSQFPKKWLLVALLFLLGIGLFLFFPLQKTYISALKTKSQAQRVWDALKKQNIEQASIELEKTKKDLQETESNLSGLSFLQFVPIANWYYNDVYHLMKAGASGLDAVAVLIDSIKPYADVLGLKGAGSFVMGSAEQRIQTAILAMGKITPRIDDIAKTIEKAKTDIDAVDPNHYPPILALAKVRNQLIQVKTITDQSVDFVDQARPLIKVLPSLLGEPQGRKYLVLFQNDKELRPTGGFLTAYAIFRVERGIIHVDRSDDIYTLDNAIRNKPKAPDIILKYLPLVTTFNLRDSNLSPDFTTSMNTFKSLYETAAGKTDIDGIIALDTSVLVSVIKILDDEVVAGGITFTTKPDKRCDCPQVIYTLEQLISTPKSLDLRVTSLASVQAQRKDILGTLLYAVMQKALKSSPKLYWGPLVQDLLTEAEQKHVLFYLYNKDAQNGIESLNVAGKIKSFDGDYLHINDANFGGAKSNLYVKESVSQNLEVGNDGKVTKTLTIQYKNPYPPSDCNLERGGLCLNATLRDFVRVYVPKGSVLLDGTGSEVKVTTSEDLGKTVFEGFLTVRPQGAATYTLKYRLPFTLKSGSPLPLLIQKQPGTDRNEYTIKVNGRDIEKFELLTDRQVNIKI